MESKKTRRKTNSDTTQERRFCYICKTDMWRDHYFRADKIKKILGKHVCNYCHLVASESRLRHFVADKTIYGMRRKPHTFMENLQWEVSILHVLNRKLYYAIQLVEAGRIVLQPDTMLEEKR